MKCVCCNAEIEEITDNIPKKNLWGGMWKDGIVEKISAGYGSVLDGDMYVLAICDACVKIKANEGVLVYVGNYMFNDNM